MPRGDIQKKSVFGDHPYLQVSFAGSGKAARLQKWCGREKDNVLKSNTLHRATYCSGAETYGSVSAAGNALLTSISHPTLRRINMRPKYIRHFLAEYRTGEEQKSGYLVALYSIVHLAALYPELPRRARTAGGGVFTYT